MKTQVLGVCIAAALMAGCQTTQQIMDASQPQALSGRNSR